MGTTQSPQFSQANKDYWRDLYHLSRCGGFESYRDELRELIERNRPGFVSEMDERMRQSQIEHERLIAEREERVKKPKPVALIDAINNVFKATKPSQQEKFWRLAHYCFGQDQWRPRNLVGQWADLSPETRQTVLQFCHTSLIQCEPTPIPDGSTFPSVLLYESWAFSAVLREDASFALSGELIRKWLPCSYFMGSESWNAVVFKCHEVSPTATEDVVLAEARRELRSRPDGSIMAVGNYPRQFWSQRFAELLRQIVLDVQYGEEARANALKTLTTNAPDVARPALLELFQDEVHGRLWTAALDGLLRIDPEIAWEPFRSEFDRRGKNLLSELTCFYSEHRPVAFTAHGWTRERLVELIRMLLQVFPEERNYKRSGHVTIGMEYTDIRWSIIQYLYQRNQSDDRAALNELATRYPRLREWLDHYDLREATARAMSPYPYLPFETVVHLLENADFQIIRHSGDLLDAVADCLRRIGETTGRFIEMLYLPNETSKSEHRRHESALQAFVECRLSDLLPGRITDIGTTIRFHREAQGHFRNRTDVLVSAPTITNGLAEVVIEVKWSDNNDAKHGKVCNALTKQLGETYLLSEQRTHGIYLVGWTGKNVRWNSQAGPNPKRPHTTAALEEGFRNQASNFNRRHPAIFIIPIVWDLQWPNNSVEASAKDRR